MYLTQMRTKISTDEIAMPIDERLVQKCHDYIFRMTTDVYHIPVVTKEMIASIYGYPVVDEGASKRLAQVIEVAYAGYTPKKVTVGEILKEYLDKEIQFAKPLRVKNYYSSTFIEATDGVAQELEKEIK